MFFQKVYPMGVERAALNTMAIRCYQNHLSEVEDTNKFKRLLFNVASRNLKYIKSMQKPDGGFDNTIYSTSLAIHADLSSQIGVESDKFDFAKARKWLVNSQKEVDTFIYFLQLGLFLQYSEKVLKTLKFNNFTLKVLFTHISPESKYRCLYIARFFCEKFGSIPISKLRQKIQPQTRRK